MIKNKNGRSETFHSINEPKYIKAKALCKRSKCKSLHENNLSGFETYRKLSTETKYVMNIVSESTLHISEKIQAFIYVTFNLKYIKILHHSFIHYPRD